MWALCPVLRWTLWRQVLCTTVSTSVVPLLGGVPVLLLLSPGAVGDCDARRCISLYLPTSPCISLYLPVSPSRRRWRLRCLSLYPSLPSHTALCAPHLRHTPYSLQSQRFRPPISTRSWHFGMATCRMLLSRYGRQELLHLVRQELLHLVRQELLHLVRQELLHLVGQELLHFIDTFAFPFSSAFM